MKRYGILTLSIAGVVLLAFLIVEALDIGLLVNPSTQITGGGVAAAILSAGLLVADVFIPVPSSVVMIANGAAFGILGGFLLSWLASIAGGMVGWLVGARSRGWVNRIVSAEDQGRARSFLAQWGLPAIIVSRVIPILAETVAIMTGVTGMSPGRALAGIAIGSLPPALLYAIAGHYTTDFVSGALVMIVVVALTGIAWWAGTRIGRRQSRSVTVKHVP